MEDLRTTFDRVLAHRNELEREVASLKAEIQRLTTPSPAGQGEAMENQPEWFKLVAKMAALLRREFATNNRSELVARALYEMVRDNLALRASAQPTLPQEAPNECANEEKP